MTKVVAAITTSVDGYIAGPDDGPDKGLGEGGERLHYWVFGGPWSYEEEARGEPTGEDAAWLEEALSRVGAVVGGRWLFEGFTKSLELDHIGVRQSPYATFIDYRVTRS